MPKKKRKTKKVFISSTVYDLRLERKLMRTLLENVNNQYIDFEFLVSDHPDFPISPADRTLKHSYDICLDKVAEADYFVLLLKKRYGDAIIEDNGEMISITHSEFREARKLKIPRFVLLDQRTWDAKEAHNKGRKQEFIQPKHVQIFDFIDEIRTRTKGNWIDMFRSKKDITSIVSSFVERYDDASFVDDVTIPNGHRVRTDEHFVKTWEIANVGLTVWKNRSLREDNPGASGLVPDSAVVALPRVLPGERVRISIGFTAPSLPATCESYWKMIDSKGSYCFPHKFGLECRVKVI